MDTQFSRVGVIGSVSLCFAAPSLSAQEIHETFLGRGPNLLSLFTVENCRDLDGDGVDDILLGAPNGAGAQGVLRVVSGATGDALLPDLIGDPGGDLGISGDSAGDFDGDGTMDLIAGDSTLGADVGMFAVYSGVDGAVLFRMDGPGPSYFLGFDVAGIGDVNGDNFDDVLVSRSTSQAFVFLGPNGALFRTHTGPGTRVQVEGGIGDVDQDGVPDYMIGWPQDSTVATWSGKATVFSGADGSEIWTVYGTDSFDHLGRSLASTGDLNGDSIPDFAVGVPGELAPNFGLAQGRVEAYSGADGSLLFRSFGNPNSLANYGHVLDGGMDVNGDGAGDLIVGAPGALANNGVVEVLSGVDGAVLWRMHEGGESTGLGKKVAVLGDLNGDGRAEFALSEVNLVGPQNAWSGRVTVFEGAPGHATRLCSPTPNSGGTGASLHVDGPISVGNNELTLRIAGGVPNRLALFFYGPGVHDIPVAAGDGLLCVNAPQGFARIYPAGFFDGSGSVERAMDFTTGIIATGPLRWAAGSTWTLQAFYRDPGGPGGSGYNLTDALRVQFLP